MDPFNWLIFVLLVIVAFGGAVLLWLRSESAALDRRFGRDPD